MSYLSALATPSAPGLLPSIDKLTLNRFLHSGDGIFNVRDATYAAPADCVVDGSGNITSGTDAAPFIQEAADDLIASGGGVLYLPGGAYRFQSTVTLNGAGFVAIVGDPGRTFIYCDNVSGRIFSAGTLEGYWHDGIIYIGNMANAINASAVLHHGPGNICHYSRLGFYGISATNNLITSFNSYLRLSDIKIGGSTITGGASPLTNGYVACLGTGEGMYIDGYESADFGVIRGIGYSRGSGGAFSSINFGDPYSADSDQRQMGYVVRNSRIDENANNAIYGVPSGSQRYAKVTLENVNINVSDSLGTYAAIMLANADSVDIIGGWEGLHEGSRFHALKLINCGDVRTYGNKTAIAHFYEVDANTKSLTIVGDPPDEIVMDSSAPIVTVVKDGLRERVLGASSPIPAKTYFKRSATVGEIVPALHTDSPNLVEGIVQEATGYATGDITAIAVALIINNLYMDLFDGVHTAESTTRFFFNKTGGSLPGPGTRIDLQALTTAQEVSNAIVAAVNSVGSGLLITASNGGGTTTKVTFVNDALGGQGNTAIQGNLFTAGQDWQKHNFSGGRKFVRTVQLGAQSGLLMDGNDAISVNDLITLSTDPDADGRGMKATTGAILGIAIGTAAATPDAELLTTFEKFTE